MATFAIIDSAQRPRLHERLDRLGVSYQSLFAGQAEESLIDIAPLVVAIEAAHPAISAAITRLGEGKPAVSYIETELELADICSHFGQFHLVKVEPEGREMLMRWYDTRILPEWDHCLTPAQKALFYQGISGWQYYDRNGRLECLHLDNTQDVLPIFPPMVLDAVQYEHLLRSSTPDALIAELKRILPDEMRSIKKSSLYPFIKRHFGVALEAGVTGFFDQIQFMLMVLYSSGEFLNLPQVQQRLAESDENHVIPFAEWAMQITNEAAAPSLPLWERPEHSIHAEEKAP